MALDHAALQARDQLERVILPFWLSRGIDRTYGGFHTGFDNRGRTRTTTDKFTWSQGRFVWLLARAAQHARRGRLALDARTLLADAEAGARFLLDHAVVGTDTCAFRVTERGELVNGTASPARSVYADCFVVMGLAELARATGEAAWLSRAEPILARARADILAGTAPTPPYEVPAGYRAFGPTMILLNTLLVHAEAARALGLELGPHRQWLAQGLDLLLAHRAADGTFAEMLPEHAPPRPDALLDRHRVPGHAIEGLWVALDVMELLGDTSHQREILDSVPALCSLGWDPVHGGLLRYTDADGGAPRGNRSDSPYEDLVARTWDTKLWWVHTEAAATAAISARRHGDAASAEWFERIWDYTLDTFPGGADGEEWVQIRDREGRPLDEVVALPVKDPFHITRNLMQLLVPANEEDR
ncbi:AGE family epimerase/isomerase [Georgenia halophila]|uniref:AGE family epimerase/isomerase n=1 Tax=Georgenia halophila TaxID=620889 RepID=A0ABP8LLL3_9MICO